MWKILFLNCALKLNFETVTNMNVIKIPAPYCT